MNPLTTLTGGHQLSFSPDPKTEDLIQAAKILVGSGSNFFEATALMPDGDLSGKETGKVLSGEGITHASVCSFFLPDGSWGMPLGTPSQQVKALDRYKRTLDFGVGMRDGGLTVEISDGPFHTALTDDCKGAPEDDRRKKATDWCGNHILPATKAVGMRAAVEFLQNEKGKGEDRVLRGMDDTMVMVEEIDDPAFGVHFDYRHEFGSIADCKENPEHPYLYGIKRAGKKIYHVHIHDKFRGVPGAQNLLGYNNEGELVLFNSVVDWEASLEAFKKALPQNHRVAFVSEFFSRATMEAIPGLDGLAFDPAMYFSLTSQFLREKGFYPTFKK